MRQMNTRRKLIATGAIVAAAVAIAGTSASAQTATTTAAPAAAPAAAATADALQAGPPQTFSKSGKPTSSTPKMVREAIQRSQARTKKLLATGTPEQFGSEEPFVFDPNAQ